MDNNKITRKPTGFQLAPENINRNGAPKKDESISGLVRDLLRNKPQGQEKTYRELFAMRVMKLALEGDMTAIKEIWDRMDGKQALIRNEMNIDNRSITYVGSPEQNEEIDKFVIERYKQLKEENKI